MSHSHSFTRFLVATGAAAAAIVASTSSSPSEVAALPFASDAIFAATVDSNVVMEEKELEEKKKKGKVRIVSVGDWGSEDVLTSGVAQWASETEADAALLIGDNFYPLGLANAEDKQFEKIFKNGFLGRKIKEYYVVAGNHDYYGNVTAQLALAKKTPEWKFPSLYYTKTFSSSGVKVFVIATDAWGLNGGDSNFVFNALSGKMFIKSFENIEKAKAMGEISAEFAQRAKWKYHLAEKQPGNLRRQLGKDFQGRVPDEKQYQWLEAQLESKEAKEADWVVVTGHYPVVSCTTNWHHGVQLIAKRLKEVLERHRVDAYIFGHDHTLQHIRENGISYFGSGAGGKKDDSVNNNYPNLVSHTANVFGYMDHEFTSTTFKTTTYASVNGEKVKTDEYVISKETKVAKS